MNVSTLLICGALSFNADEGWLTATGRPHGYAVVQAKCVFVTDESILTFRIAVDHVFAGNRALVATVMEAQSYPQGNAFVFHLDPKPQVGERGIWIIPEPPNSEGLNPYIMAKMAQILPIALPARNIPSDRCQFDQAMEWAQALEHIESLRTDERVKQLKTYASGKNVPLAVWAIHVLGMTEDGGNVLGALAADRAIPVQAQIALDEVLSKTKSETWLQSSERRRMLDEWPSAAKDDGVGLVILNRLEQAVRAGDLEGDAFFQLVFSIARKDVSDLVRSRAVSSIRWVINNDTVQEKAVGFLASILEGDGDARLKLTAAEALAAIKTLGKDRTRSLISKLKDQYVTQAAMEQNPQSFTKSIVLLLEKALHGADKR